MANPKFFACDLSVPTYSWSAGANASFPVSNLKNYFPDSLSKSNATTDGQQFIIDMGSAVACTTIVLEGFNGATQNADSVAMVLQADDNSGFTSPETIISSGAWNLIADTSAQVQTFASKTYRYWRITFTKGSALGTVPAIGNIFLGTTLDFEKPQQFNFYTNAPMNVTSKSRALDGRLRTAQTFNAIRKHKASFKLLSDSFVTSYKTFLSTVRNDGRPFYYIDKDSNVYCVNLEKSFNPYDAFRYNLNDIVDLLMESTLADT